jgi:hypothetical protein
MFATKLFAVLFLLVQASAAPVAPSTNDPEPLHLPIYHRSVTEEEGALRKRYVPRVGAVGKTTEVDFINYSNVVYGVHLDIG